jgi:hypothetical protein
VKWEGYIAAISVIVIDIAFFITIAGTDEASPTSVSLVMATSRFMLTVFGEQDYFIGHAVMFFLMALYFGGRILDKRMPRKKENESATDVLSTAATEIDDSMTMQEKLEARASIARRSGIFDMVVLAITTVIFGIDIFVERQFGDHTFSLPLLGADRRHWEIGLVSLFAAGVTFAVRWHDRVFYRYNYRMNWTGTYCV